MIGILYVDFISFSIAYNQPQYLGSVKCIIASGRSALINGVESLAYRGIPLVEMPYWDEYSETDLNQPDKHLVLLTTPANLVVATDTMSSMNSVKVRFEEFTETTDYKVKFKIGSNYVHPSLMVAAY